MKTLMKRCFALAMISSVAAWAGALTLQISNADANAEAKSINAALVAQVTACHEPAKSTVTAHILQLRNGEVQRTPLKLVALKTGGMFAVVSEVPAGSVVDFAVSNPEYKNYEPRVFLRCDSRGVRKDSIRRFYSTPPTEADMRAMLAE